MCVEFECRYSLYYNYTLLVKTSREGAREMVVRLKNVGWLDAGWGNSLMGNNKHMYQRGKVTSMLFVAKAELR